LRHRQLLEQLDTLRIDLALKAQKTVNDVTHWTSKVEWQMRELIDLPMRPYGHHYR
jgi:hypothetical protein